MSALWKIHCLDCNATHGDKDRPWDGSSNGALMMEVVRHAISLSSLKPLYDALGKNGCIPTLRSGGGRGDILIDVQWFANHAGHRIVVRDEHKRVLGECLKRVRCEGCASSVLCRLQADHDGDCSPRHDSLPPSGPPS